jgi:hypothetical protein
VANRSTAKPGSIWVDNTDSNIHYIDFNKDERYITSDGSLNATVTSSAKVGSTWIESNFLAAIPTSTNKVVYHYDAHDDAHTNLCHQDFHADSSHSDSSIEEHVDSYSDLVFECDGRDSDAHGDDHADDYFDQPEFVGTV